jgi:vancomycin aglycone glucosyltransferase
MLWNALANAVDIALGDTLNQQRRRRGLPPVASVMEHLATQDTLVASDPILGEVPPDLTQAVPQTGAIVLADEAPLDAALEQFLDRGEPPVYVGFGSMPGTDPRGTTFAIAEALAASGRRGVISSGWAGLGRGGVPPGVFVIGPVPHAKLLPRVAVAVHHGGAGTTAAAARAGVPQVVVPHLADQFYWAHQVHRLGLGSRPVPRQSLTARSLARAIKAALSDPEIAARAQATRECLARSDGLGTVARLIGEALEDGAAHPHAA